MKRYLFIIAATLLLACDKAPKSTDSNTLYVSILPLKYIAGEIVGQDFDIRVLVPAGASPETFEPTPKQFVDLNKARMIFNVGLIDFEKALLAKIEDRSKVINLSQGIDLIEGSCSHVGNSREEPHRPDTLQHTHAHGVDPHVWTSPGALQRMAANAYEAIHAAWPDSVKYTENYRRLTEKLQQLDRRTREKINRSNLRYFIIYHPALTYYARDYGIRQVAIESDGKEPSAKRLAELIRMARKDGIHDIFYQNQFPASVVETIARDINARTVAIDPLREDVIENIDSITDLITNTR